MNHSLQKLMDQIDGLAKRERLLMLSTFVIMLYAIWFYGISEPQRHQQERLETEESHLDERIQQLTSAQKVWTQRPSSSISMEEQLQERNDLVETLRRLKKQVRPDNNAPLISPKEMVRTLDYIALEKSDRALIQVNVLPVIPLIASTEADPEQKQQQKLFKHGMILEWRGNYFSALGYLKTLESLKNRFYWESIEYQVEEYPTARVRLHLFTLSLDEAWMEL